MHVCICRYSHIVTRLLSGSGSKPNNFTPCAVNKQDARQVLCHPLDVLHVLDVDVEQLCEHKGCEMNR